MAQDLTLRIGRRPNRRSWWAHHNGGPSFPYVEPEARARGVGEAGAALRGLCRSSGQQAKTLAAGAAQGLEVSVIECEDCGDAVSLGKYNDRGIGQADVQVVVSL